MRKISMRQKMACLSTQAAAMDLGISVGTVQKLVDSGKLEAFRTLGGHRRIYASSVEKYQKENGYLTTTSTNTLILHHGDDIDPDIKVISQAGEIYIAPNFLEVIQAQQNAELIFIDARSDWFLPGVSSFIQKMLKQSRICFYNGQFLASDNPVLHIRGVKFINQNLTRNFLMGFKMGIECQR